METATRFTRKDESVIQFVLQLQTNRLIKKKVYLIQRQINKNGTI